MYREKTLLFFFQRTINIKESYQSQKRNSLFFQKEIIMIKN